MTLSLESLSQRLTRDFILFQKNAAERFGGFQYGDNFVVRDHVAERKSQATEIVFKAPYDLVDCEDVMNRVRTRFVEQQIADSIKHLLPEIFNRSKIDK